MRVRVYRNLNKGGISIQSKTEKGWRVSDYCLYVVLKNCKFKVQEGGRQRVLAKRQKNVHAWVEGDLVSTDQTSFMKSDFPVPYYNPYTQDTFTINNVKVSECDGVKIFCPPLKSKRSKPKKSIQKKKCS